MTEAGEAVGIDVDLDFQSPRTPPTKGIGEFVFLINFLVLFLI